MKQNKRHVMALGASLSLVALTGCSGILGSDDEANSHIDQASGNVEDVPALSEIDDFMWKSMEEAGSVTISTEAGSG